ncbi:MAG: hypothetical protein ABWY14_19605 [Tardiphaga sp.]
MTQTDFIAACFWPTMIPLVFLIRAARDTAGMRWSGQAALCAGTGYFLVLMVLDSYSLVALLDLYVLCVVAGCLFLWLALRIISGRSPPLAERKSFYAVILCGVGLLGFGSYTLFCDFAMRPLELEGRVERVWVQGGRRHTRYVRIASQNVKAIIPDYQRLELLPVVRVEVGRGSNYIYKIEYLSN